MKGFILYKENVIMKFRNVTCIFSVPEKVRLIFEACPVTKSISLYYDLFSLLVSFLITVLNLCASVIIFCSFIYKYRQ